MAQGVQQVWNDLVRLAQGIWSFAKSKKQVPVAIQQEKWLQLQQLYQLTLGSAGFLSPEWHQFYFTNEKKRTAGSRLIQVRIKDEMKTQRSASAISRLENAIFNLSTFHSTTKCYLYKFLTPHFSIQTKPDLQKKQITQCWHDCTALLSCSNASYRNKNCLLSCMQILVTAVINSLNTGTQAGGK